MSKNNDNPQKALRIIFASGSESVTLGGSVTDSVIVVGNNNVISLTKNGALAFQLLSDGFRQQQANSQGNAFYDGATPNWANIAHGDDSERTLLTTIRKFIRDSSYGSYKTALILGLAGEGKTTLLRRLAWSLAEEGHPVLTRDYEHLVPTARIPISTDKPLVLVFDEADQEERIPRLASELAENGVPFIILMAARLHEWRNSGLEGKLKRTGGFKPFLLDRLSRQEVEPLLDKLSHADNLVPQLD